MDHLCSGVFRGTRHPSWCHLHSPPPVCSLLHSTLPPSAHCLPHITLSPTCVHSFSHDTRRPIRQITFSHVPTVLVPIRPTHYLSQTVSGCSHSSSLSAPSATHPSYFPRLVTPELSAPHPLSPWPQAFLTYVLDSLADFFGRFSPPSG